jgi:uncharacterized protein (DUF302 family)
VLLSYLPNQYLVLPPRLFLREKVSDKLITRSSKLTVNETAARLKSLLESKNIKIFAHIDHTAAAKDAGMDLNEEQVLVFGDPRVGTNLMQEQPQIGIELPLKILIWHDNGTKVAYREPLTYVDEFGINSNRQIIEKMSVLMATLVNSVVE